MTKTKIVSVQASAGSGKTYNLAKRYIYLLFKLNNNIEIKNIVAITFTNKAAFEMKNRVINYLKKAALSIYTDDFFDDFKLTKIEITKKSLKILETIFKLYDDFNISTIDSFKNHILKSCAFNINISPNFTIEKDYSSDLMFSVESFFKNINNSESKKQKMLKYLLQYINNSSGWIPKKDIYTEIEKIFNKSSNIGKNIFVNKKSNYNYEFVSRIKVILKKINIFSKKINDFQIHYSYKKAIKKILDKDKEIFLSMKLPNIFSNPKLKYNNAHVNFRLNIMWNNIHKEIKHLYKYYMKHYYDIYSNIYFEIYSEFNNQSKKKGIVFLNEINQKIVSIFNKNNNIIPEIYYRLSEQYKHFLIDEFQDINLVQWIGIKRFLEESLASNGTFFYVGDIKQAIYAFRGGNYNIFNIVKNEFKNFYLDEKKLKYNFRSGQFIVDFNNNIFSIKNIKKFLLKIYKNKKDFEYILNKFVKIYEFSKQKSIFCMKNCGYIETKIINSGNNINKDIETKIIKYIIDALKRFNLEDIVILCRTNEEVCDVSSLLLLNKIKVKSPQTLNIKNNDIIKQIISFIKFVNNFNDNISFASFIIGDIFYNVSNEKRNNFEKFIFDFNNNKHNKINLYNFFKIKYAELCNKYFDCFFVEAGFVSVYELTILFLEKFLVIDNFYESKIFIMRFLEFIKEFEIKNFGIDNFVKYFDNLKNYEDSLNIKNSLGDGVNVMTIHKSKGLQFPVVIIPFVKPLLKNIDKLYFNETKTKIKLFNISKNISDFLKEARTMRDNEKFINLLSEINIFYVAMTRAEYELYCIVPEKIGNIKNIFSILLGDNDIVFGVKRVKKIKKTNNFKNIIIDNNRIGYKNLKRCCKYKNKLAFDINNAITDGNIIHYTLSKIISLKNANLNRTIDNAVEISKKKFFFGNFDLITLKLKKIFKNNNIFKLFMYDKNKIYNEKEIVDKFGNSFIVDKLIFDKNKITIVDFKSSDYNMIKDIKQVKNYISIMLNMNLFCKFQIIAYIVNIKKCTCSLVL